MEGGLADTRACVGVAGRVCLRRTVHDCGFWATAAVRLTRLVVVSEFCPAFSFFRTRHLLGRVFHCCHLAWQAAISLACLSRR